MAEDFKCSKDFEDISWDISEEEYRKDPALSYSTLAKYERTGFNELSHLFDKIETPSLTFGSAVDSIITGGQEEFDIRFMVAEFPPIPDSIIKIIKSLFNQFKDTYSALDIIPNNIIIEETIKQSYQLNWKPETRAKVIKEKGSEYYNLLYIAEDKTIIDTRTYNDVCNAVNALKDSTATKYYFAPDTPFDNVKRYYQLKFKAPLNGRDYRCMADLIIIDYDKREVTPIDLKTSSHTEWDFYKSFIEWRYDIQARLYWRIIRYCMDTNEYFSTFRLNDYKFIVVNKKTLTPLVWNFPYTREKGILKVGKNKQIIWRDPETIGEELHTYLEGNLSVPIGINQTYPNDLSYWINNY